MCIGTTWNGDKRSSDHHNYGVADKVSHSWGHLLPLCTCSRWNNESGCLGVLSPSHWIHLQSPGWWAVCNWKGWKREEEKAVAEERRAERVWKLWILRLTQTRVDLVRQETFTIHLPSQPPQTPIFLFFSHSPLFFILRPQSAPSHKRTSRYHHKGVLVLQRQGQNKTCLLHCSWYFEPGKKAISQRFLVEAVNSWDKSKSCLGLAFISFKV